MPTGTVVNERTAKGKLLRWIRPTESTNHRDALLSTALDEIPEISVGDEVEYWVSKYLKEGRIHFNASGARLIRKLASASPADDVEVEPQGSNEPQTNLESERLTRLEKAVDGNTAALARIEEILSVPKQTCC